MCPNGRKAWQEPCICANGRRVNRDVPVNGPKDETCRTAKNVYGTCVISYSEHEPTFPLLIIKHFRTYLNTLFSVQFTINLTHLKATYRQLTNYMEQNPPWDAKSYSASHEIYRFYVTRRFITVFTNVCHWSPSCARCIHSTPSHPIFPKTHSNIIPHTRLGLHRGLFPTGLRTKLCMNSHTSNRN